MLENKFLTKQKERYTNQINFIKNFLSNNSKPNNFNINNSSNNNLTLIDQINYFYNFIVTSNCQFMQRKIYKRRPKKF